MTVVPLTDGLQIIDVVDEKSGITFRYSNHDIQTGDIQVEAEKLEEKAEVLEELEALGRRGSPVVRRGF